jgi:hypothetical protein
MWWSLTELLTWRPQRDPAKPYPPKEAADIRPARSSAAAKTVPHRAGIHADDLPAARRSASDVLESTKGD